MKPHEIVLVWIQEMSEKVPHIFRERVGLANCNEKTPDTRHNQNIADLRVDI